jgi:hypothetical protein
LDVFAQNCKFIARAFHTRGKAFNKQTNKSFLRFDMRKRKILNENSS